jgi:hypothetical protein
MFIVLAAFPVHFTAERRAKKAKKRQAGKFGLPKGCGIKI